MTKLQFITALHNRLSGLPKAELEERLNFYIEMIEDRMEEGLSEEDAVAAVGTVEEIAAQITADITAGKTVKEKPQRKRWSAALTILGAPVWIPLLITAFAVVFSLYISLWAVIISLWACFVSFAVCCPVSLGVGILFIVLGNAPAGIALIGCCIVLAGLSIFFFFGCKAITDGTVKLTGMLMKRIFKKEAAK